MTIRPLHTNNPHISLVAALISYAIPALHHVNTGDYSLGPAFQYGGVGFMITMRF